MGKLRPLLALTAVVPVMAVVALAAACGQAPGAATVPPRTPPQPASPSSATLPPAPPLPTPLPSVPTATTPPPAVFLPAPDAPVPTTAAGIAHALAVATLALRASIDAWEAAGGIGEWPPPRRVVLQALYQQRLYRALGREPALASRVIARLPGGVAAEARTNVAAGTKLFSLVHATRRAIEFRTRPPLPAAVLLRYYREAERRFHVSWEVLAAVNYIESKFGRVVSPSSAGAQGPMQFIPSTWAAYGMGGDVHDPHDAILGAANYLHASGAPGDYRSALYSYNHAEAYVDAVLLYARHMVNDPRAFFEYYNWQVFVLRPGRDVRLTGPGLG